MTAAQLRKWVLDQPPGTAVTEGDAAARWYVSRPTAKHAITMLVNDGLLRQEPNKPAYVPELTEADARDLFGVQIPLELEIARRAAAQSHVLPQATFAVYAMGQLTGNEPIHEFVEADLGFHLALLDSVNSPRLTRLYRAIQGEIHLTMVQSRRVLGASRIHKEHEAILEAVITTVSKWCDGVVSCRHGR
jgi:DNA-binding GntR family transcriptional regulator